MHDAKWEFVHSQILASSINASLQRANAYAGKVTSQQRDQLHDELTSALRDIGSRYSKTVAGSLHEAHIQEFMGRISPRCATVLADRHLRLGVAAKALNLYLKYLWCLGRIPTPPHCPFDRRVIVLLPRQVRIPWTQMDDLASYRALVRAATVCAHGESLAEWELRMYQGVQQRDAADEGRLEANGSTMVGTVIVNHGRVVRPSQLIASVRRLSNRRRR